MYLWRAVDDEGEVLDVVVQRGRDAEAALKLIRRLLRNQPVAPETITTDGLASYAAALEQPELRYLHRPGRLRDNNRVENSHLPIRRRERQQQRFKSQASAQRFLTTHAAIYNTFNIQRHLISRSTLRRFRADADTAWAARYRLTARRVGVFRLRSVNLSVPIVDLSIAIIGWLDAVFLELVVEGFARNLQQVHGLDDIAAGLVEGIRQDTGLEACNAVAKTAGGF